MRAILPFLLLLLGLWGSPLGAQDRAPLVFSIDPETGAAGVEVGDLISDLRILEAMHSGLPLRIQVLVQLWRDGFFDDEEGRHEWRASLLYDPLTRRYRVQAGGEPGPSTEVNTLEEARARLQQTLFLPLRPRRPGRYYYIANVEVETLSLSDLEELQRWLRGELAPAVAGEEEVGGALAKGVRRVLVRMLNLPARRFQVRSPSFEIMPPVPSGGG
jgi:hypothetical protein